MRFGLNIAFVLSLLFIFIMSCEKEDPGHEDAPIMNRDTSSFSNIINPAHVVDSVSFVSSSRTAYGDGLIFQRGPVDGE